ncbi:DUF1328 domain-containing protein [Paraflavitalea pollutisoli]|uniref:DUF1328 domain-containing protein n=1 Tax=Paraflavitalea pollutisoli TaxID=3034143 RepID=UPI0023EB2C69|nr:DUF1328 domain-containing protein [Paraflavitalea sp. H1-2-19X]
MHRWTVIFFIVAVVSAFLGFDGLEPAASSLARPLYSIFIVLFFLSMFGKRPERVK